MRERVAERVEPSGAGGAAGPQVGDLVGQSRAFLFGRAGGGGCLDGMALGGGRGLLVESDLAGELAGGVERGLRLAGALVGFRVL